MTELPDLRMHVNREILAVVNDHLSKASWPDGECVTCGNDDGSDHGADHLIAQLVEHFKLPWVRRYDAAWDGAWPPSYCEDAEAWRKAQEPTTTFEQLRERLIQITRNEENDVSDWADENEAPDEEITDADVIEYPEEEAVVDADEPDDEELDDLVTPLVQVHMFDNIEDLLIALRAHGVIGEDSQEDEPEHPVVVSKLDALDAAVAIAGKHTDAEELVASADLIWEWLSE